MMLKWNFQRGGPVEIKKPSKEGMDIFWKNTLSRHPQ